MSQVMRKESMKEGNATLGEFYFFLYQALCSPYQTTLTSKSNAGNIAPKQ